MTAVALSVPAASAQVSVGIENTRLVYGKYTYKDHYSAKLNVSVYSEKIQFQYLRGTLGYDTQVKNCHLGAEVFFGSSLNRFYYNAALNLSADFLLFNRLLLEADVAPWYDSGYGYKTCYQAMAGCRITDHIDVKVGYSTLPEYRMAEGRIRAGFDFHVSRLYVAPYVSIGPRAEDGGKNVRVVFGFGYQF